MSLNFFLANLGYSVMFQQCKICPERVMKGQITTRSNSMFLVARMTKHSKICLKNSRKASVSLTYPIKNFTDASCLDSGYLLFVLGSLGCCGWFWLAVGALGWFWLVLASFCWFWVILAGFSQFWLVACFISNGCNGNLLKIVKN